MNNPFQDTPGEDLLTAGLSGVAAYAGFYMAARRRGAVRIAFAAGGIWNAFLAVNNLSTAMLQIGQQQGRLLGIEQGRNLLGDPSSGAGVAPAFLP